MKWPFCVRNLALLALLGSGLDPLWVRAQANDALTQQQAAAIRLLHGAVEMHFHVDPPTQISPGGVIDQIRQARRFGLRAVLLKSHGESTAGLAYHLGLEMPDLTLIGGIALNRPSGGINLAAVERLASIKGHPGRVVWMPTEDSEAQVKLTAQKNPGKPVRQAVAVSKNGQLLPEVKAVIAFVGKSDLTLATGHLGAEDALLVLREGQAQGLKHMIATHPMDFGGKMTLEQMQQAAKTGALLEFDFRTLVEAGGAEVIKTLGVEHCFISELWTYTLPGPPAPEPFKPMEYAGLEGVGRFVEQMHAKGFSDQDLDLMLKTNPARLLGLPPG
jgi:hypothetical protein